MVDFVPSVDDNEDETDTDKPFDPNRVGPLTHTSEGFFPPI